MEAEARMKNSRFDHLVRSLHREGPRRWVLKSLAVGVLSLGMLSRDARSFEAQADEMFQQCLRACLASCGTASTCPSLDMCAQSCSQAMW